MKRFKLKSKKTLIILSALIVLFIALALWGNVALQINEYEYKSEKVPSAFDGFRIAHVSDLHDSELGKEHKRLIEAIENSKVDIIAVTGDSIDCRRPNAKLSLKFFEQAVKIAPCYYVVGNHEAWIVESVIEDFFKKLSDMGVIILRDEYKEIEKDGEIIRICGIDDPDFEYNSGYDSKMSGENIKSIIGEDDTFKILLSHRPTYFENYVTSGADVVLSGHAHGGQFRLPFVGGIYAPDQGFFPEYDSGIFEKDNTTMYVSRGIGNSAFPLRLNNRPELLIIELVSGA